MCDCTIVERSTWKRRRDRKDFSFGNAQGRRSAGEPPDSYLVLSIIRRHSDEESNQSVMVPHPSVEVGAALSYVARRSRKAMWILERPDGFELDSEEDDRIELDSNPAQAVIFKE